MLGLGLSIPRCAVRAGDALTREVASILAKYGTDAHVYLPGIGVINGFTAGNYLDSAGTTAATVDNPVGLVLDAAGSVGSELVTNGDFTSGTTGWTLGAGWSIGSGVLGTLATGSNANATTPVLTPFVIGNTYLVTMTVTRRDAGSVRVGVGGFTYVDFASTVGTFSKYIQASASTANLIINNQGGLFSGDIDNISVKEVTGIHASQATTANKPILRRGAVNLLTYSEQFDNGAWTKSNSSISQNAITAPDGTLTADKLLENTVSAQHYIQQSPTLQATTYTYSIYAKKAEREFVALINTTGSNQFAVFNLTTGSASSVGANTTASITLVANDFYRCSITFVASLGTNILRAYPLSSASSSVYVGDVNSGIYIWGAQLQTGSEATDYIPTTTAAASSSTGNYHWIHDSTDLLTTTYPAGYESATVINALAAGQQTLTAQNIVGSYSIGPSVDTYGRFIFRTGLTASELATMQTFANRLAGV